MTPATYQLTVEPPPEFALYRPPRIRRSVSATATRASENNFVLRFDGRVHGSIRNATGGPAAGVRVQLMRIESTAVISLKQSTPRQTPPDASNSAESRLHATSLASIYLDRLSLRPTPPLCFQ